MASDYKRFLTSLRTSVKDHKVNDDLLKTVNTPATVASPSDLSDFGGDDSPKETRYSWRIARAFIQLRRQSAATFELNGLKFPQWPRTYVPTLGASSACRVQQMHMVKIPGGPKLFVKLIPIKMWNIQWAQQNTWDGEYTTDGENFVMEAAALAFLHEYAPGIAPKLVAILEVTNADLAEGERTQAAGFREKGDATSHIGIVSELYGEDLLDFLDHRDRKHKPLEQEEKRGLQVGCVLLLRRLHSLGIAHLDFTPENILVGPNGLRLCDFAKSTPLLSRKLRHVEVDAALTCGLRESVSATPPPLLYPFESCEPTVGKGAYMPPECWKIYWRLESQRIQKPLDDLRSLRSAAERVGYYFKVGSADMYMVGVVLFWVWSEGGIWNVSDARQDEKYHLLVTRKLNLDLFKECRDWPAPLKICLQKLLCPEPWRRLAIDELLQTKWLDSGLRGKYLRLYTNRQTFPPGAAPV